MNISYAVDNRSLYTPSGSRALFRRVLDTINSATSIGKYEPSLPLPDEFTEFEAYNHTNWDGYGADPISSETCKAARAFRRLLPRQISLPDIAPGADGTIGFEWREGPPSSRKFTLVDIGPGDLISARIIYADNRIERLSPSSIGRSATDLIYSLFPRDHGLSE
jgi:hypothetical protein